MVFRTPNVTTRSVFAITWADLLHQPKFKRVRTSERRDLLGCERAGRDRYTVSHLPEVRAQFRSKRVVYVAKRLTGAQVRMLRPQGVVRIAVGASKISAY